MYSYVLILSLTKRNGQIAKCVNVYLFTSLIFWTQACTEGMCTNGTQIPCEGCHPCPIPQHVKVGHTNGVYDPFSFGRVMWVLLRPTRANQWKCCETGPTVFCPYPRRLESLTICRCHYKGSSFFSVISRARVLAQPWFEPLKLPLSKLALSQLS